MHLVEQHRIGPTDPRFVALDMAAFASKNLYNKALYHTRQAFFANGTFPTYPALYRQMKAEPEYAALPRKVAQWVLKQVCAAWDSYRKAAAAYYVTPALFLGQPRIPRYLDKQGRNLLVYTAQALSQPGLRTGQILPSGLGVTVLTKQVHVIQVRVVPHPTQYTVEVVYVHEPRPADLNPDWVAGVDLGVNTLAALASNKPGFVPVLVNGRPLKALNQDYNKRRAQLQAKLPNDQYRSHHLDQLAGKRHRRLHHLLHVASRQIINLLVRERIGTVVIGKNDGWKQQVRLGKRNNQAFVFLPHAHFIAMLAYKAELVGIRVILTEESHTSKCSFLDGESLEHHEHYAGRRVKRGLFMASTGQTLHADVNGAYNMIRKVFPTAFASVASVALAGAQGIGAVVVRPVPIAGTNRQHVA